MPGLLELITAAKETAKSKSSPRPELFVVGNPKGMVETGTINILARPKVTLPDGKVATVASMSFSDDSGYEILVPTIGPNGELLSQREAIDLYYRTGQHLGKFKTPETASSYAQKLHEQQADYYLTK